MTEKPSDEQLAALNEVLSEVVDLAVTTRQARHAVPPDSDLHAEIDRLWSSARDWATRLVDVDSALGVSALAYMTSPRSRLPAGSQHPAAGEEIRRAVVEQLDRVAGNVRTLLAQREDERVREVLGRLDTELGQHRAALTGEPA